MRNPVDPEVICHAHLNMGAQQRNAYAGVKSPCTYDLLLVHSADTHDASLSRSAPPLFRSVLFALAAFDWAGTFESPVERKRCVDCRQQEALQLPLVLGQLRSNSPGSLSSWCQVQVPAMQGEFLQPRVSKNAQRGPAPSESSFVKQALSVSCEETILRHFADDASNVLGIPLMTKNGRSFRPSTSASLL